MLLFLQNIMTVLCFRLTLFIVGPKLGLFKDKKGVNDNHWLYSTSYLVSMYKWQGRAT